MRWDMPDWIIPTEFKVINPGQTEAFYIDAEKWSLKRYQDISTNARELQLTTLPEVPIQQFAEVLALDGAELAFRGYVERYKKTQKESIYYCRGIENLLYHRFCRKWNYAGVQNADSTYTFFKLKEAIKDHYSPTYPISYGNTDNCPGLLHVANSLIPPGIPFTVYDAVKKIIKYANWGTKSRMGANPILYYVDDAGVYPLTKRNALLDLQTYDTSFFIDSTDLYIRNTTNKACGNCGAQDYWYWHGRVLADNIFDTKLRIGITDYEDIELQGFLSLEHNDTIADQLFGVIQSFGLHAYLEDKADATYIHSLIAEGSTPGPEGIIYIIDESDKETIAFEKSIPDKPRVHSLLGIGDAEQIYSWANYGWKGLWYSDAYQVDHGYRDTDGILQWQTNAEFNNRLKDFQYYIKTTRKIFARPGDTVRVIPLYDEPEDLPINVITNNSDGITILELNHKMPLFTDAWKVSGQLSSPYSNYYFGEWLDSASGSCSFYMRTPQFPSCAFGTVVLHCPDLSTTARPRATLDVSMHPYTGSEYQMIDPLRFFVMISVNGNFNEDSIIYNYAYGDPINSIDITNIVNQNADNTIGIQMYYFGGMPYGAASCNDNSHFTATITMRFFSRRYLWS
jgi:hypothetical protein